MQRTIEDLAIEVFTWLESSNWVNITEADIEDMADKVVCDYAAELTDEVVIAAREIWSEEYGP